MPEDKRLDAMVDNLIAQGLSDDEITEAINLWQAEQKPRQGAPAWTKALPAVAGQAAGLFGKGTLAGMGLAGLGGAVGEGTRGFLDFLYAPSEEKGRALGNIPANMVVEAAKQAAVEPVARILPASAKGMARFGYRFAARPAAQTAKYSDLVTEGLKTRTVVSPKGLEKAEKSLRTRKAIKDRALAEADQRVGYSSDLIAREAAVPLSEDAARLLRAGQPNPADRYAAQLGRFRSANPPGSLGPSSLETVKRTLDDMLGGAYRKLRMKEPVTPRERANIELSQAASRAQESVVPGYRDMNREIMTAEGLRRMIERRVGPQQPGGNDALWTGLAALGGPKSWIGRVLTAPKVSSGLAIGLNEMARVGPLGVGGPLRALLTLLKEDNPGQ